MSTRSRERSALNTPRPPLVGRLHEMATTHPVPAAPTSQGWWQCPRPAGEALIRNPQTVVFGRPGRGAMRRSARPVVVLDEAAACEAIAFSGHAARVFDPLTFGHVPSNSSNDGTGTW